MSLDLSLCNAHLLSFSFYDTDYICFLSAELFRSSLWNNHCSDFKVAYHFYWYWWWVDAHSCNALVFFILVYVNLSIFVLQTSKPTENHDCKTLCCWCCASGPINGCIRIPRQGYVPGEIIYIDGGVENFSNNRCEVDIKLNMVWSNSFWINMNRMPGILFTGLSLHKSSQNDLFVHKAHFKYWYLIQKLLCSLS